jgi:hypothetical protein
MSDLKRVQTGEKIRIPAQTWNNVLDATEDFLRRSTGMGAGDGQSIPASGSIVPILNSSGADVDRMNILGISAPAILPTDNMDEFVHHLALVGVTPTEAGYKGKFAVTMAPIANGAIGLACISGLCPVNLTITSSGDTFADVKDGDTGSLKTGTSGSAFILWQAGGSGTVLGIVRLANLVEGGVSLTPVLLSGGSGGTYTGREQVWSSGAWSEKSGATDLTCINLCETTGGHTSPVDAGAIVLATKCGSTYFFTWSTNAKYKV